VEETTFKNAINKKEINMDFLKTILGEELFKQVQEKINAHNGNEENKENQVKLANLGKGEYVDRNKYSSLEAERNEATKLINELKKTNKGNEELQGRISNYETKIQELETKLSQERLASAIKINLLNAKATDIDYLTFKLGNDLKLNENGEIEGWKDKLDALKIQLPNFFEASQSKEYVDGKLPQTETNETTNLKDYLKMSYQQRVEFAEKNPEAFKNLK
jgi:hypothetical protein